MPKSQNRHRRLGRRRPRARAVPTRTLAPGTTSRQLRCLHQVGPALMAIRRALAETAKLQRYETRAIARRDRAIGKLVSLTLKK